MSESKSPSFFTFFVYLHKHDGFEYLSSPSVAANLASMLAETSVMSPGATGLQPPWAASGESLFLTTLDAVADMGGFKMWFCQVA